MRLVQYLTILVFFLMIFSVFRKASLSHMKGQVSRLAKPAVVQYVTVFRLILAKRVKHWSRDWDGKASYCELWCGRWRVFGLKKKLLGVKTIRQEQNWCWFLTRPASMCPFQNGSFTFGILNKSTESAKFTCDDLCGEIESYWERVMWRYFARIKCGNIVSGWLCRERGCLISWSCWQTDFRYVVALVL